MLKYLIDIANVFWKMAKAVQLITISDSKYIQKIDSLNSVENVSQIYLKKNQKIIITSKNNKASKIKKINLKSNWIHSKLNSQS